MLSKKQKTQRLVESGILIGISILSATFLKFEAPWTNSGSITLFSMTPIVFLSYKYGVNWGCLSGVVFGLIGLLLSSGFSGIYGLVQDNGAMKFILIILLDYIIAFGVLGTSGIGKKIFKHNIGLALTSGAVIGIFLRMIIHIISGVIIWGNFAGGISGAIIFSIIYNTGYMIPEIILTAIASGLIGTKLKKYLTI